MPEENEQQQQNADIPPPPPPPQMMQQQMMQSPAVTYAEAKEYLKQSKAALKLAMKNAQPTMSWFRPAHSRKNCQYCPVGTETPLTVDHSTGLYREACANHQYLIDNIHSARAKVRKFETMLKRIKDQEIVPRAEITLTYDSEFTADERAHLRDTGWIHKEELVSALQKLLKDLQLEGK
jgi:hypothetical protein